MGKRSLGWKCLASRSCAHDDHNSWVVTQSIGQLFQLHRKHNMLLEYHSSSVVAWKFSQNSSQESVQLRGYSSPDRVKVAYHNLLVLTPYFAALPLTSCILHFPNFDSFYALAPSLDQATVVSESRAPCDMTPRSKACNSQYLDKWYTSTCNHTIMCVYKMST